MVFSVLFEVHPYSSKWDAYLALAKSLRSDLEQIDGFIDNIRYSSFQHERTLLSLSHWRDEKALVRWRTLAHHHLVQEKGRQEVFEDYHLRVGEVFGDSSLSSKLSEQRFDATQIGPAATVVLVDGKQSLGWIKSRQERPSEIASYLGLDNISSPELADWDVFEAVLTPGDLILLTAWRDRSAADRFEAKVGTDGKSRVRKIRVIRDYGMFDRREAPQYYPDAEGKGTIHA